LQDHNYQVLTQFNFFGFCFFVLHSLAWLILKKMTEVMLKCIEFADDMGPDLSTIIFLDCKTGGIGELPREDCLIKRIISSKECNADGNEIFLEAAITDEARDKIHKVVNENPRLNIGFGTKQNQYDTNAVTISEMEKVQNMWGVKLKKTPKNAKGEEFIFICQKTSQFGEMSRQHALESGLITEVHDENTKSKMKVIEQAYVDFHERSELVEKVRSLLNLGIPVAATATPIAGGGGVGAEVTA
jgi:hypothetical protein